MKRILLIENRPDFGMGGVENYNCKLCNILKLYFPNVIIDKAALLPAENGKNPALLKEYYYVFNKFENYRNKKGNLNFYKISFLFCKFRSLIYSLENKYHYNLIIDSTVTSFKKFCNKSFYFWIQHNTPSFYSLNYIKNRWIRWLFLFAERFFGVFNNLKYAKNLVLYDEFNFEEVKKNRKTSFNGYIIPLSHSMPLNMEEILVKSVKNKKRILYFGRIDDSQKNIRLLISINNLIHLIDFYGRGDQKLINELGNSYKGFLDSTDNLENLLIQYKYMILMSNYEGFSFSLVQALCYGLPIIIRNTFTSAQFLINNNKNGFLLKPNLTVAEYSKKIMDIYQIKDNEYLKLSKNAYEFAKNNLSNQKFNENWLKIFHKFLDE